MWPELRQYCLRREVQLEVVDMRWGIRDESTDDQQTVNICLSEIMNCQVGACRRVVQRRETSAHPVQARGPPSICSPRFIRETKRPCDALEL